MPVSLFSLMKFVHISNTYLTQKNLTKQFNYYLLYFLLEYVIILIYQ